jgi:transposase
MAASRPMKAREVRRTKVILRLAAGQSYRAIMKQESCSQVFIARWKERFVKKRLAGLYARTSWQDSLGANHRPGGQASEGD